MPYLTQLPTDNPMNFRIPRRLSRHKAVLVFTHSEMLMRAAKVVHVMDEGVIVESGEYGNLKSLVGVSSRKEA